jgi:vitamin B12 transporter
MTIALLLATAAASTSDIIVNAALVAVPAQEAPASVTIIDQKRIEALGAPFALDLIRLAPGISVSTAGAQGTLTQIRIRGAEANHSLVYVDGIAFNDVAANNSARFETLTADGLGRMEIVRGPQSALWGSEALGGVIAMATPDPLGAMRASGSVEYGSHDFRHGAATFVSGGERGGVSASASWMKSDGIDILGGGIPGPIFGPIVGPITPIFSPVLGGGSGDRDGFENRTASLKAVLRPDGNGEIGIVGHYIHHDSEFDGTDAFFRRADTAEASVAETYATRAWATIGLDADSPWSIKIEGQYLNSENRNRDGAVRTNDTDGRRTRIGGQLVRRLAVEGTIHELIAGIEREDEEFATRDLLFGGGNDRDLKRGRNAFVGEWRASWGELLVTDIAVRHDDFDRFEDATTLRAGVVAKVTPSISLLAAYGEGIAQPSFVDLFGFSSSSGFVGNPALTPEKSKGYEAGVRWTGTKATIELTAFSNNLHDEIVEDFSLFPRYTVINAAGKSRRRGIELSGDWRPIEGLRLSANYSYLDARERPTGPLPSPSRREIRRPKHTANLVADWTLGRLTSGASLAYVGSRRDIDFDTFIPVKLGDYVLAGARVAYAITPAIEAFGRVDNAFDANYRDQVGYATPGRTIHAGLRVRLGD